MSSKLSYHFGLFRSLLQSKSSLLFSLYNLRIVTNLSSDARYITIFLAFFNVCLNPFIYATKSDPVKKYLRQKLCNRRRKEGDETVVSVIIIRNRKRNAYTNDSILSKKYDTPEKRTCIFNGTVDKNVLSIEILPTGFIFRRRYRPITY